MVVVDEEGQRHGPFVQKHWRQDWLYQPEAVLAYHGEGRFAPRPVPAEQRRGRWSQTVYQVDDSPRYASLGRWEHGAEASIWEGDDGWRPLPRREHSVRDDYQVLAGRHRLTVLPTGWIHEQDNLKLVLAESGTRPLARELGVNRYERLRDFDFSAGDAYWTATGAYWARVREAWARRLQAPFHLESHCDERPAFMLFFEGAGRLEAGEAFSPDAQREEIEAILDCLVTSGAPEVASDAAGP